MLYLDIYLLGRLYMDLKGTFGRMALTVAIAAGASGVGSEAMAQGGPQTIQDRQMLEVGPYTVQLCQLNTEHAINHHANLDPEGRYFVAALPSEDAECFWYVSDFLKVEHDCLFAVNSDEAMEDFEDMIAEHIDDEIAYYEQMLERFEETVD